MVGSVDAPEPGFRPGALGALARAGGSARQNMAASEPARFSPRRALGILARWGPGMRRGSWRASGVLACAGGLWRMLRALVRVGGLGFPWRLTLLRLCLGWCAVCVLSPGFLFAGLLAVANAMFYFALTWLEYTGCEHVRA